MKNNQAITICWPEIKRKKKHCHMLIIILYYYDEHY